LKAGIEQEIFSNFFIPHPTRPDEMSCGFQGPAEAQNRTLCMNLLIWEPNAKNLWKACFSGRWERRMAIFHFGGTQTWLYVALDLNKPACR
jgi:hypothetical protein